MDFFHFQTFNEFFIRELKPGARPIASVEHDDVAICAADCRLMAFKSVEDSLRFWIKVFLPLYLNASFSTVNPTLIFLEHIMLVSKRVF